MDISLNPHFLTWMILNLIVKFGIFFSNFLYTGINIFEYLFADRLTLCKLANISGDITAPIVSTNYTALSSLYRNVPQTWWWQLWETYDWPHVAGSTAACFHNSYTHIFYINKFCFKFLAATKQLYEWFSPSVRLSVCLSVRLSHLFDYVPIIVSS